MMEEMYASFRQILEMPPTEDSLIISLFTKNNKKYLWLNKNMENNIILFEEISRQGKWKSLRQN